MAGGVFVGRHKEVDQLKAKFENSLSGRGGMVALVGEPGIGKTRTSFELETYAGLRNAQVLWGRCYEGAGAPPYWPWVQAIRSYLTNHEPDELRQQMGSTASVISEIVTDVKDRLPDVQKPVELDDPESARFRLFDSIATFLKNAGQVKPIVLILDDLHWADKPSLMLLEFVARELASSRVLIVGTYRDMELNRRHPLAVTLGDLTRERLFERVLLRGLTRADVGRFVEIAAGITPPSGLVDAIHTQTEGNPLFVTETVRLLIQEGEFATDQTSRSDSSWNIRIPEGVREVIGRRLDKLSQRCNDMLTTASIIGRVFTLDQIREVVEDTSEGQLLDVIDEALAARAIEEMPGTIGKYQFTHALIQETLSGELSTTRRVRLHAAIAVALESLWGDKADENATQLAEHFAEAETVLGSEKLVHYLEIAGNQALDAYGYEEAQRAFERALRALEGVADTLQIANLWHGLGTAQAFTLGRNEMQTTVDSLTKAFDVFVEMGQTQKAIQVGLTPLPNVHGPQGMVHLIERAIELVLKGTADHARLLAEYVTWVSMESLDHSRVEESVNEALKIATSLDDHALELRICAMSILPISAVLGIERALEFGRRAVELSETVDVPGVEVVARETVGTSMVARGDMAGGMLQGDASVKAAERSRSVFHLIAAYTERANRAILLGDWDSALADIKAVAMRDPGEIRVLLTYYKLDANTADHERVMERLARLWERARTADDAISIARSMGWRAAAEYSYMLGRDIGPPDVEKIAEEDRRSVDSATLDTSYLSLPLVESHVFIDIVRGETGRMEESYRLLREGNFALTTSEYRTRRLNRSRIKALASTALGKYDRAEDEFDTAIQEDSKIGAAPDLAWTRYEYADMVLKRAAPGDQEKANQLQDEAIAVARELGMNLLLERVLSQREILKA
jgi:tetratricopeptide (TPR) repeat protein